MNCWKNFRISLQAVILSGVLLVLGKVILYPALGSRTFALFVFPSAVPLPGWQPLSNHALVAPAAKHLNYISGRHYQYIQKDLPLDIEMHYLVDTDGDVKKFIKSYTSVASAALRHQEEIGFYGLFTYQGKAYLSSCINPHGGSTFTDRQFKQNRNTQDMQPSRLLPWLLGQENFKDERCLWTQLSIPLKHSSPERGYRILESAWFSWYQWWRLRFPKP